MASYHLAVKTVQRSAGRTATAAAAYRHAARITCDREGRVHDYRARSGVEAGFIVAPEDAPDWVRDRAALWNAAEARETRVNGVTAREWELALPSELDAEGRRQLAQGFAAALVARYGVAADVAIHAPHREGDQRNWHAHVLTTTRTVTAEGLTDKTRLLDAKQTGGAEIAAMREVWAGMQNAALERHGSMERVDHRSLEAQREAALARGDAHAAEALERPAETKLGPAASGIERRERRAAEREERAYAPVTDRGARVHAVRQARGLVAELSALRDALKERVREAVGERLGLAREGYAEAREAGAGRVTAGLAALRAAAQRQGIGTGAGQGREVEASNEQNRRHEREHEASPESIRERLGRIVGREEAPRHAQDGPRAGLQARGPDRPDRQASERSLGQEAVRERLGAVLERTRPGVPRETPAAVLAGQGREEARAAMERPEPEPRSTSERRYGAGRRDRGTEDIRRRLDTVLGRADEQASTAEKERERERPEERARHREEGHGWEL